MPRSRWIGLALLAGLIAVGAASFRSGSCVDYADGTGECTQSTPIVVVVLAAVVGVLALVRAFRR